jgi:hypothetical protein
VGGGETAVSIVGNDSGGTAVCIVGNGGGETAVSGVATAVFGNKVWGNGRPIVSRQCRTATLSAQQIMNGETAVSGVATAVFGNKVWGNGRPNCQSSMSHSDAFSPANRKWGNGRFLCGDGRFWE